MTGFPEDLIPSRPVLAAPVGGFAARVLAITLDAEMPKRIHSLQQLAASGRLDPNKVAEVVATWAAIREASRQWSDAAAGDSTADPVTAMPECSQEIDTDRAAGLLGVTPNRVRQLARCGELPGRKTGRQWLVDRTAVELRRSI